MFLLRLSAPRVVMMFMAAALPFVSSFAQLGWQPIGLIGERITAVAVHPSGTLYAGTADHGVYRTADAGKNWLSTDGAGKTVTVLAVNRKGYAYAGYQGVLSLSRSKDDGSSWQQVGSFHSTVTALTPYGDGGLCIGNVFITRSTDDGDTWTDMPWFKYQGYVQSVAVSWAGYVHAIITAAGTYTVRSTDNSNHWDSTTLRMGCRVIAVKNSGTLFVGSDSGVFRSTDWGDTWISCNGGLAAKGVRCIAISQQGEIVIGTKADGVFASKDDGASWTALHLGLTDPSVTALAIDAVGMLYAGTASGGVFRTTSPLTGVDDGKGVPPVAFNIGQNYPNPFSSSTRITLSLPERSVVRLHVYDALGREVASLANAELAAGTHVREWNAGGLPDGTYFIRMQAGSFSAVRKAVLRQSY